MKQRSVRGPGKENEQCLGAVFKIAHYGMMDHVGKGHAFVSIGDVRPSPGHRPMREGDLGDTRLKCHRHTFSSV